MEGAGKLRCPKCHDYAIKQNVNGEMVYKCKCGRAFKATPVASAQQPR